MIVYIAEFVGTAILVLLGNGVVANNLLGKNTGYKAGPLSIYTGWGFAVFVAVLCTGWVSGAHINPAVTLGLWSVGAFEASMVWGYIFAQVLGAMMGSLLVFFSYKKQYDAEQDTAMVLATFSTGPKIKNYFWNFITELIGTMVLVFAVMALGVSQNNVMMMGPFFVGVVVFSIGLSLGGPTGYAINPARDLGPRLMHALLPLKNKGDSNWAYAWVPVLGPALGGVVGAMLFKLLFGSV